MKKILLTGGSGFVGRHFCKRFLDSCYEVVCVDPIVEFTGGLHPSDWPLFDPRDYESFSFIEQDCRDYFTENPNEEFDYAFHLAAVVGGRLMIEHNPIAVAVDLSIDAEFWQWAVKAKPKKSICFSSSAAYPIKYQTFNNFILLKEEMIDFSCDLGMPDMSYGWAKLTHEYMAKLSYQKHGIQSVIYRPFSGYGEDQDMSYPFPSICKRILDNPKASVVEVWGTGDQMRDFIHIDDCIDGVLMTMDLIDNADALNLSTGKLTSFKEFVNLGSQLLGFSPEIKGTSDKPEGVFARGGDTTKQVAYGFTAKTSLAEGILNCYNFLNARSNKK